MASKKRKTAEHTQDIRIFFGKENNVPGSSFKTPRKKPKGVADSQTPTQTLSRVKNENGSDSPVPHSHNFTVKFSPSEPKEYTVHCDQPRSVSEAIRCSLGTIEKMNYADENIIIQLGKKDRESVVPTHFPCSCVGDGESLILYGKSEKIEAAQGKDDKIIYPKEEYSVFYIDTVGGVKTKTKTKDLFRSKTIKQFKYLCVYGEKGMTVEEASKRDGRFIDNLREFKLSDNENPNILTLHSQRVDSLHQKAFKITLPSNKRETVENPKSFISDVARGSGRSIRKASEQPANSSNIDEIYELSRQQFPDSKKWMESRFPGDSYQEILKLRKENFGKIQQPFREVHRIDKLLKMGKSVCKIIVSDRCQGTGFVMFDRFISTSAHSFNGCVQDKKLPEHIDVYASFNYENSVPVSDCFWFSAEKTFVDIDDESDYAVLELKPEGQKSNPKTKAENIKVPPGSSNRFSPLPENGEACIIGHPAGEVKKIDFTCIIEPENREQAVKDHLAPYNATSFTIQSIIQTVGSQGIENIMVDGSENDKVTYNTFMYHGASGSPVFDGYCSVFGLHTAGFTYGFQGHTQSVIEYAHPVVTIFEKFVSNSRRHGNVEMSEKVEEAAAENTFLKNILQVKPMEVD